MFSYFEGLAWDRWVIRRSGLHRGMALGHTHRRQHHASILASPVQESNATRTQRRQVPELHKTQILWHDDCAAFDRRPVHVKLENMKAQRDTAANEESMPQFQGEGQGMSDNRGETEREREIVD